MHFISGTLFTLLKINWFDNSLTDYLTKGVLEKVLSEKITNNNLLLETYFKSVKIKVSIKKFLNCLKVLKKGYNTYYKSQWYSIFNNISNIDSFLDQIIESYNKYEKEKTIAESKDHRLGTDVFLKSSFKEFNLKYVLGIDDSLFFDIINQASILQKKINTRWSSARFNEEHEKMTNELMVYAAVRLEDKTIEYKFDTTKLPSYMKLLSFNKDIFKEGHLMSHCVYTNYYPLVESYKYLVFLIKDEEERVTLGLRLRTVQMKDNSFKDMFTFDQCYKKRNQGISNELRLKITTFLNQNEELFLYDNVVPKKEKQLLATNEIEEKEEEFLVEEI